MVTVRVYGMLVANNDYLLVSDECIGGKFYTKFPGGGLEPKEGLKSCVEREFLEETGLGVSVLEHVYTLDTYVESKFKKGMQVLAVYYTVAAGPNIFNSFPANNNALKGDHFFINNAAGVEKCRWVQWKQADESMFQLESDQKAFQEFKKKFYQP